MVINNIVHYEGAGFYGSYQTDEFPTTIYCVFLSTGMGNLNLKRLLTNSINIFTGVKGFKNSFTVDFLVGSGEFESNEV